MGAVVYSGKWIWLDLGSQKKKKKHGKEIKPPIRIGRQSVAQGEKEREKEDIR